MSLMLLALSLQLGPIACENQAAAMTPAHREELALHCRAYEVISTRHRFSAPMASGLAYAVVSEARLRGLSPSLVLAVIQTESSFRPRAVSSIGAEGLMQIRPPVGEWLADRMGESWAGERPLFDPVLNVRLGVYYLAYLVDRFDGDVDLALAAYNWGPTRVEQALQADGELPEPMRGYPRRVWRAYAAIRRQARTVG